MFRSCNRLEQLTLSGNQLSSLGAYTLPALSFLTKLDLSHNVIVHVSPKAFLNLGHSLKTLDLRGNLLVTLHGQLLLPVYKVQVRDKFPPKFLFPHCYILFVVIINNVKL